jgi:hypothetical protein
MATHKASTEIVFDGALTTAVTAEASPTIYFRGYLVSTDDFGRLLIVNGGKNFVDGLYVVESVDTSMNSWTLDRTCTTGVGASMLGRALQKSIRRQDHVRELYDQKLPSNPGKGEARRWVLATLHGVEPLTLTSLAERCFHEDLLKQ